MITYILVGHHGKKHDVSSASRRVDSHQKYLKKLDAIAEDSCTSQEVELYNLQDKFYWTPHILWFHLLYLFLQSLLLLPLLLFKYCSQQLLSRGKWEQESYLNSFPFSLEILGKFQFNLKWSWDLHWLTDQVPPSHSWLLATTQTDSLTWALKSYSLPL